MNALIFHHVECLTKMSIRPNNISTPTSTFIANLTHVEVKKENETNDKSGKKMEVDITSAE